MISSTQNKYRMYFEYEVSAPEKASHYLHIAAIHPNKKSINLRLIWHKVWFCNGQLYIAVWYFHIIYAPNENEASTYYYYYDIIFMIANCQYQLPLIRALLSMETPYIIISVHHRISSGPLIQQLPNQYPNNGLITNLSNKVLQFLFGQNECFLTASLILSYLMIPECSSHSLLLSRLLRWWILKGSSSRNFSRHLIHSIKY